MGVRMRAFAVDRRIARQQNAADGGSALTLQSLLPTVCPRNAQRRRLWPKLGAQSLSQMESAGSLCTLQFT